MWILFAFGSALFVMRLVNRFAMCNLEDDTY